jgi:hypothetical protein
MIKQMKRPFSNAELDDWGRPDCPLKPWVKQYHPWIISLIVTTKHSPQQNKKYFYENYFS